MRPLPARSFSRHLVALTGLLLLSVPPALAAEDDAPKGPAVTVLKVAKSCFSDIVEATGTIIAREETSVRPERPGLKVTEVPSFEFNRIHGKSNLHAVPDGWRVLKTILRERLRLSRRRRHAEHQLAAQPAAQSGQVV